MRESISYKILGARELDEVAGKLGQIRVKTAASVAWPNTAEKP